LGNIYVSEVAGNTILKLAPSGQLLETIAVPTPSGDMSDFAVSPMGTIFVADRDGSHVGRVTTVAGSTVFTPFEGSGSGFISLIAFDRVTNDIVAATEEPESLQRILRFNSDNGSLTDEIARLEDFQERLHELAVDDYGSIYATGLPFVLGLDPVISADQLDNAVRDVVLQNLSFDDSPQGKYLRGLAVRAARTTSNLESISEVQLRLDELRRRANFDVEPPVDDLMSFTIEQINGFLTAVKANSPLVVGDTEPSPDPPHPLFEILDKLAAGEPFYGRYRASQPIGFPQLAHLELMLDPATATSNFIKPGLRGRGDPVRPEVISSTVSLDFNGLVPTVNEFTMVLGSFEINGQQSGLNRGRLSPSGQLYSQFGRQGRDFEAHVEGWITNDLYPESRPLFTFLDLQGFRPSGAPQDVTIYGTNQSLCLVCPVSPRRMQPASVSSPRASSSAKRQTRSCSMRILIHRRRPI
jgi:hypothetical protein